MEPAASRGGRRAPARRAPPRPTGPVPAREPGVGLGNWRATIETTVGGLHYELVDIERAPAGLLRVYIDRVPGQVYTTGESPAVTVDDCELVTRQLQYALEVEGADYTRLEVSSPGLDRPLRNAADFARFVGHEINVVLKMPLAGRKNFRGLLQGADPQWSLVFHDGKADQQLAFALDELREARLVPVLDFKGKKR